MERFASSESDPTLTAATLLQLTAELKSRKLQELSDDAGLAPDMTFEVVKLVAGQIFPVPFIL